MVAQVTSWSLGGHVAEGRHPELKAWVQILALPYQPLDFGQVTEIVCVSVSSSIKLAWAIIRPKNSYLAVRILGLEITHIFLCVIKRSLWPVVQ